MFYIFFYNSQKFTEHNIYGMYIYIYIYVCVCVCVCMCVYIYVYVNSTLPHIPRLNRTQKCCFFFVSLKNHTIYTSHKQYHFSYTGYLSPTFTNHFVKILHNKLFLQYHQHLNRTIRSPLFPAIDTICTLDLQTLVYNSMSSMDAPKVY